MVKALCNSAARVRKSLETIPSWTQTGFPPYEELPVLSPIGHTCGWSHAVHIGVDSGWSSASSGRTICGSLWKVCVWGLKTKWCLPAQPVMLVSCLHTCQGPAPTASADGESWLACGLSLSKRSLSCGGLLTPGLSTLILSPCLHPSACGTWAGSSPPCSWKEGWSSSQTSSGTLLHYFQQNAAKEGRLRRLQRLFALFFFLFCSFPTYIWCK